MLLESCHSHHSHVARTQWFVITPEEEQARASRQQWLKERREERARRRAEQKAAELKNSPEQ